MSVPSESHAVKLTAEYDSGGVTLRGIASRLWEKGLFIKTQKPFQEDTVTNIRMELPTGNACSLMGIVKRARRHMIFRHLNGMEVELHFTHRDYIEFLNLLKKNRRSS
jgi:hypothetical protein